MLHKILHHGSNRTGYGDTIWDAITQAVGKLESDTIRKNLTQNYTLRWTDWFQRSITPQVGDVPARKYDTLYETCGIETVSTNPAERTIIITVYRSANPIVLAKIKDNELVRTIEPTPESDKRRRVSRSLPAPVGKSKRRTKRRSS